MRDTDNKGARKGLIACRLVAGLILITACGQGSTTEAGDTPSTQVASSAVTTAPTPTVAPSTDPAPTTSTTTASTTTTAPGVMLTSSQFLVPFQLAGGSNWTIFEQSDFLAEVTSEGSGEEGQRDKIYFTTIQPADSGALDLVTTSPYLEATATSAVEIGGATAQKADVTLLAGLNPQDTGCSGGPGACLILAQDATTSTGIVLREGMAYRVWVVDVNGTTVSIVAEAQQGRFAEWAPAVEEALQGLTWQG